MKRLLCLIAVCAHSWLPALPVGNPSEPELLCGNALLDFTGLNCPKDWFFGWDECLIDAINLRLGYYGDFVFNRYLKVQEDRGEVSTTRINTNAGYVALNGWNWFDIFFTLGASQLTLEGNDVVLDPTGSTRFFLQSETQFSWSLGGRIAFFRCECLTLGFEGQYLGTRPNVSEVYFAAGRTDHPQDVPMYWREWQLACAASYRMGELFSPYAGFKWARGNLTGKSQILQTPARLYDMQTARGWGYCLGVTLIGEPYFTFTAEGRFADELALYINGQFQF